MPLIKKEHPLAKKEMLSVRVDPQVIEQVRLYGRFLESSQTHVVESIVGYVCGRDKEFQTWLTTQSATSPEPAPAVESTGTSAAPARGASVRQIFRRGSS